MPLIDQQKAIDKFKPWLKVKGYSEGELNMLRAVIYELEHMPPAPQMTLTEDDLETIRIHMSAHKEDLCNQGRWKEAREYEDLLAKLPSTTLFVSPWPIRCRDCYWWTKQEASLQGRCALTGTYPTGAFFCGNAKQRSYPCDPEKNTECSKTGCYINGGECRHTLNREYARGEE